jgi:hypothetical protein
LGIKKGGHVKKHAKGGEVEGSAAEERKESKAFEKKEDRGEKKEHMKFAKGGMVGGGDTKARVRAGRDNC